MKIKGKKEEYDVMWSPHGWSYAVPVVYGRRKVPLLPFMRWKKVWTGSAKGSNDAEKMHPEPMKKWFQDAVDDYEKYVEAWENNEDNNNI